MTISDQKDGLILADEIHATELPELPKEQLTLVSKLPLENKAVETVFESFKPDSKIIQRIFNFLVSNTAVSFKNLQFHKEKKEIAMNEYVLSVDSKLDLDEVRTKIKEQEISGVKAEYEAKVRRLFNEGVCSVQLEKPKDDPKFDLKSVAKSLTFSMDLYQYLAIKLKESALDTNVDYMTITTTIEKQQMTHIVEFELKTAGQNWSNIFSKFIGKDIYHKIEWAGGLVDGYHTHNLTHIRDSFVFAFIHQRMEFLESISESKNHKSEINQDM